MESHPDRIDGRAAPLSVGLREGSTPRPAASEWLGLLRSLMTYHAVPFRARRWRTLYASLLRPGDLGFDIGAHVGNRLRAMRRAGARVVALEPQPLFIRFLRRAYGADPAITLLPYAVGASAGRQSMKVSRRTPTVSTLSTPWMKKVVRDPSLRDVVWDTSTEVNVTTLDQLIEDFGLPAFCKIDTEGSEPDILRGLSRPLPSLSFELLPAVGEQAQECIDLLESLGTYRYNWTLGEQATFRRPDWASAEEASRFLTTICRGSRSGELYARLRPT